MKYKLLPLMGTIIIPIVFFLYLNGIAHANIHTKFLTPVCISPFKEYHYKTCHPIKVKIDDMSYTIPEKFETDLASIPRFFWIVTNPAESNLMRAAIVHDWFYRMTCDFNRKETDLIFYHMLINDGTPRYKAAIFYYAVRLFGWKFYNEDYCE